MATISTGRDREGYTTSATLTDGIFTIQQQLTYAGFRHGSIDITEAQARKMAKSIIAELEKLNV